MSRAGDSGYRARIARYQHLQLVPPYRPYFLITPHAIRAPALPAGSDFMSSAFS